MLAFTSKRSRALRAEGIPYDGASAENISTRQKAAAAMQPCFLSIDFYHACLARDCASVMPKKLISTRMPDRLRSCRCDESAVELRDGQMWSAFISAVHDALEPQQKVVLCSRVAVADAAVHPARCTPDDSGSCWDGSPHRRHSCCTARRSRPAPAHALCRVARQIALSHSASWTRIARSGNNLLTVFFFFFF